jgi:signal transduction histidine kinase
VEADHERLPLDAVVTVPAGKRDVAVRYTGTGLAAPEAVRFRYRLVGLERDWVDAADRRTSQYSYLPPGRYRFEVMARNSDGVWSERQAAIDLAVLPHAWETWWFRALAVAAALGLAAWVARHLATRALRARLQRIERQRAVEHDRARIAKDIHDDLGAGLTQISLLSELLRSDRPQEVLAHADQIGETAAELTRAMDEIVWAVNPTEDTLDGLWSYLTHHAQEYLAAAGVACRLEAPEALPALPLSAEVRHNVFLAVKEALHNVVKHAAAREVRLTLALLPRGFAIEVRDDGCGRRELPSGQRGSAGQGLRNIAERMEAIGARCEVTDIPQGGTSVRLGVPAEPLA